MKWLNLSINKKITNKIQMTFENIKQNKAMFIQIMTFLNGSTENYCKMYKVCKVSKGMSTY